MPNIVNKSAHDKAARRKVRHKLRHSDDLLGLTRQTSVTLGNGGSMVCDQLTAANIRSRAKFNTLGKLNGMIDHGSASERTAAGKAKRGMNDVWLDRGGDAVQGYWLPNEIFVANEAAL